MRAPQLLLLLLAILLAHAPLLLRRRSQIDASLHRDSPSRRRAQRRAAFLRAR